MERDTKIFIIFLLIFIAYLAIDSFIVFKIIENKYRAGLILEKNYTAAQISWYIATVALVSLIISFLQASCPSIKNPGVSSLAPSPTPIVMWHFFTAFCMIISIIALIYALVS